MVFQPGANLYTQGFGSRPENVEVPHYDTRAPTSTDVLYPVGKQWIWINNSLYTLLGFSTTAGVTSANWVETSSSTGPVESVVGTANQVTVTTAAGTATVSLPSAITTPGSLTTTTSLTATTTVTAGTGLTVTAGGAAVTGTTTINTTGAAVTTIGTGGTGAVNIGNTTGNTAVTGSLTASTGLTATTGNIVATAGAVNAGTSMTATLGNITATNGNLVLNTAGNKLVIATGSNASVGTSGVMSGTPGAVTVATTASSATAKIFYSRATTGGTPGQVSITAQDGTGFTLTSTGNETSTFNWWIINA